MQTSVDAGINDLAPDQLVAVHHRDGPLRIIAGAGTGKTATLSARFVHLVTEDGLDPGAILALTFTRKAAGEMRSRIARKLPGSYTQLWIDTFHSFCLRVLRAEYAIRRLPAPRVIEGAARWHLLHAAIGDRTFTSYRTRTDQLMREALFFSDRARDELVSPDQALESALQRQDQRFSDLAEVYALYVAVLEQQVLFDFNRLLTRVLELFSDASTLARWQAKFRAYLVDEYQDVNAAQARIIKLLAQDGGTLAVVGDIDQAIYAFRGASHRFLEAFPEQYPGAREVVLARSYRSHSAILNLANTAIAENHGNTARAVLEPIGGRTGALPQIIEAANEEDEAHEIARRIARLVHADGVSPAEIAILLRSTDVAGASFERAMHRVGVPVVVTGASGLETDAVADVLAVLRLIDGIQSEDLFRVLTRCGSDPVDMLINRLAGDITCPKGDYGARVDALLVRIGLLVEQSLPRQVYDAAEICGHLPLPERANRAHLASIRALREMLARAEAIMIAGGGRAEFILELQAALEPPETDQAQDSDAVQVMTVHAAKGLEFEHVFVAGLARGRFPLEPRTGRGFNINDSSLWRSLHDSTAQPWDAVHEFAEEERRLFYVAITRARTGLTLSYPLMMRGAVESPSRFLTHLRDTLPLGIDESRSEPDSTWTLSDLARSQRELILDAVDTVNLTPQVLANALLAQWTLANISDSAPWRAKRPPIAYRHAEALTLSHSSIETYRTCQRRYFFRHVLRVDAEARSPYLSRGTSLHAAIQWMNEQRRDGAMPSFADVRDALRSKWSARGFECSSQERQARERSEASLRRFYDWEIQQEREILEVERRFVLPIGEHTLTGRIDCVARRPDGTIEILDYKSGRRSTRAEASSQLAIYYLAWTHDHPRSIPATTLVFLAHTDDRADRLVPLYESAKQTWTVPQTDDTAQASRELIQDVANSILANQFATTTNARDCRMCAYRHVCEGASRAE